MALKKLTKTALVAAHDEIDSTVGIEPAIDSELKQEKYEKELYSTIVDLELSKTEIKALSKATQEVVAALTEKYAKAADDDDDEEEVVEVEEEDEDEVEEEEVEEEEEEDEPEPVKKASRKPEPKVAAKPEKKVAKKPVVVEEEEDEDEVEEESDESSLVDLVNACKKKTEYVDLINSNAEFKKDKKRLLEISSVFSLKKEMLAIVSPEKEEKVVAEKKEKKASAVKKEGPGVIASIAEFIEASGKNGVTKEDLLSQLKKRFPEREEKSMRNTVNVQIPNRMAKEKGWNIVKKESGEYYKKVDKK